MTQSLGELALSTKEVMVGLTLTVRMPRSFTLRTRIACWLIGLAGRVINVPCEIEMRDVSEIRPGDVVTDRFTRVQMTVVCVTPEGMIECQWFEGAPLRQRLFRPGCWTAFSFAGPDALHLLRVTPPRYPHLPEEMGRIISPQEPSVQLLRWS